MGFERRVAWAVVLLFLSVIPVVSSAAVLLDRIVAIVNKEVITWSELYRSMEFKASDEFRALSDAEKRKVFRDNEREFLETMIDTKLQIQAAKKLDIDAGKDELEDAIKTIKGKYGMSDKDFEETLKKEGFTLEEYRKLLAEQIILGKIVTQQVKNKVVISDNEVSEYVVKNMEPEYHIRQILLKRPEKAEEKAVVEERAEEIYRKLKAGADFALLAGEYSSDSSAKTGGDLGFVKAKLLSREFIDALATMNVGEVSRPFWTSIGLHIIKLEEKEEGGNTEASRESARKKLFDKRFTEEYKNWIKGLREKAFVEVRL
ncbi:MAG TPA: peptidylprolyl isomerase [Thermodesulfovibrionales bacterium]|nr:peptidylprolyl isomerase [Thermodesulfovibrionales bacterium]